MVLHGVREAQFPDGQRSSSWAAEGKREDKLDRHKEHAQWSLIDDWQRTGRFGNCKKSPPVSVSRKQSPRQPSRSSDLGGVVFSQEGEQGERHRAGKMFGRDVASLSLIPWGALGSEWYQS